MVVETPPFAGTSALGDAAKADALRAAVRATAAMTGATMRAMRFISMDLQVGHWSAATGRVADARSLDIAARTGHGR
jgi:hypothetical protein